MLNDERPQGPGLKWRPRRRGGAVPYWFASPKAVEAGYPVKSANLSALAADPVRLVARCERLQLEMTIWLNGAPKVKRAFDGTFGALLEIYQTDEESTFHALKRGVKRSYTTYLARLKAQLQEVTVDDSDGADVKRWFKLWRYDEDGTERLPRARFVLAVLKAAISFGVVRRLKGVAEFKLAVDELEFPKPKRRTHAPTAAQIIAARTAAHAAGRPERALVYSLQYETTGRQWDWIGIWDEMSDPRPSLIHNGREKWFGPMWSAINDNGIITIKPTKTENTSGAESSYDLMACPMVQEDMAKIPLDQRSGALIKDPATGLPYRYAAFKDGWKADFKAAGLPADLWGRDLRAGGITEGGKSGASMDDRRKLATHTDEATTEGYDRDTVEAHRRVMAARTQYRKNGA